jgi:hypothetical protein
VELTKTPILVVASPNSEESIKNAVGLPGPKTANIVFTLDRRNESFGKFFYALFDRMRAGEDMLMAWVRLAPQGPVTSGGDNPGTLLIAEAGKLSFVKPK